MSKKFVFYDSYSYITNICRLLISTVFFPPQHFPNINRDVALVRPILYSNWLSKDYLPVDQEELRDYVKARLKVITLFDYSCLYRVLIYRQHFFFLIIIISMIV